MQGVQRGGAAFPVAAFAVAVAAAFAVVGLSVALLPMNDLPGAWFAFPDRPWLDGWTRWDGGWYRGVAAEGYRYEPGAQSPVVFFPAYPLTMRAAGAVVGDVLLAGIVLTVLAGLASAWLFFRWSSARLGGRAARVSLLLLLAYPFSYYLYGAVYADAFFLAWALASFVLLERGRPWLAGLAGVVATGSRPVGVALVAGLVVRSIELRRETASARRVAATVGGAGPDGGEREASDPGEAGAAWVARSRLARWLPHPGVLLSPAGLALYAGWLWVRFGDPLAFAKAAAAPGWGLAAGPRTWFKLEAVRMLSEPQWGVGHRLLVTHIVLTVAALALVPLVWRRFGPAYGVYCLAVLAVPAISSKDLFGMGRYILAAFPCFAVAGSALAPRRRLAAAVLVAGGASALLLASLFSRWYYLS